MMSCSMLYGQVANGEVVLSTIAEDVGICHAGETLEINIRSLRAGLNDFKVETNLPPGINYVSSSVTITGGTAGYVVSELDISNPNMPVFSVTPPSGVGMNWAAGDRVIFTIAREADCDAVQHGLAGGTFKDSLNVTYAGGSASALTDNDPNVSAYNAEYAVLSILPLSVVSTVIGATETRDVIVRQGGTGCVESFEHFVLVGSGLQNYSLSFGGNAMAPVRTSGDTIFYDINASHINAVGNNDNCFDDGEEIIFEESFFVASCFNTTLRHYAQWYCGLEKCQEAQPQNGDITLANGVPIIKLTNIARPNLDLCNAVTFTIKIENTGTPTSPAGGSLAKDLNFIFGIGYNSTAISTATGQTLRGSDIRSWSNWKINGTPITISSLPGQAGIGTVDYLPADFFSTDPDGMNTGLDDLDGDNFYDDLAAGESFEISWDVEIDPRSNCGLGRYDYLLFEHLYFDVNFNNQCDQGRPPVRRDVSYTNLARDRKEPTTFEAPSDVRDGEKFEISLNTIFENYSNGVDCNGQNALTSDDVTWSVTLDLPVGVIPNSLAGLPGVDYDPQHSAFSPSVSVNGNQITYTTNRYSKTDYTFFLELDCSIGAVPNPLSIPFTSTYKCGSCWEEDIHCGNILITPHCPDPCVGPKTLDLVLERSTKGWTDNSQNAFVDSNSPSFVEDFFYPGDTFKVTSPAVMSDTSLDQLFFEVIYEPQSGGDVLEYVGGEIVITDIDAAYGATQYTVPITGTPVKTNPSTGVYEMNFDISSLRTSVDPGYFYGEGAAGTGATPPFQRDTVTVCLYYVLKKGFPTQTTYEFKRFRGRHYTLGVNGEEISCDSYGDRAKYEDVDLRVSNNSINLSGCNSASMALYLTQGAGSGDNHTNEYRPTMYFDSVEVAIPAGFVFDKANWLDNARDSNLPFKLGTGNTVTIYPAPTYRPDDKRSTYNPRVELFLLPTCEVATGAHTVRSTMHYRKYVYHPNTSLHETFATAATGTINYTRPSFGIQALNPNNTGATSEVSWDIEVCNSTSNIDIDYNWLLIQNNPDVTVTKVFEVVGGAENALAFSSTASGNTYVEIEELDRTDCKVFRIYGTFSACAATSFEVGHAFDCSNYPTDPDALDAICYLSTTLNLAPALSQTQLNVRQEPAGAVDLCATSQYVIEMNSAQLANLINPKMEAYAQGISVTSAIVEFPANSGNTEPVSITVSNDTATIHLDEHTEIVANDGISGTETATSADDRKALVTLQIETDCDFRPGSQIAFIARGDRPCGETAIGDGALVRSSALQINGAPLPYSAFPIVAISNGEVLGCNEATDVNVSFTLFGASTGGQDTAFVRLPVGMAYVTNSLSCTSANAAHCPAYESQSTDAAGITTVKLSYPAGIPDGTLVEYGFKIQALPGSGCANNLFVTVENIAVLGTLSCGGSNCPQPTVAVTGSAVGGFSIEKPDFALNTFEAVYHDRSGGNFEYLVEGEIENSGYELASGKSITLEFFCGDGAGNPVGSPVHTMTINGPVANGGKVPYSGSFTASCTPANGLVVALQNPTNGGTAQCLCVDFLSLRELADPCPTVDSDPAPVTICEGESTTFSISATGTSLNYQWQVADAVGGSFSNLSNGGVYSGATTNTLNVSSVTGLGGKYYRVFIVETSTTPNCADTSAAVLLTENPLPVITAEPQNVEICTEMATSFAVTATGTTLAYKWQFRTSSAGTWADVASGGIYSGETSAMLNISDVSGLDGYEYQVIITETANTPQCVLTSALAILTVNPEPVLSTSLDATVCSDAASGISLGVNSTPVAAANYNIVTITPAAGLVAAAGNATTGDAQAASAIAADAFTNTGAAALDVAYEISPVSADGCRGDTITVTLTIDPEPVAATNLDATVCSDNAAGITLNTNGMSVAAANYTIVSITPAAGLVAAAGNATAGDAQATSAIAADVFTNTGAAALDVEYEISPVSADGCRGDTITVTLTVDPEPVLASNLSATICSDVASGINLATEAGSAPLADYNIVSITLDPGLTPAVGNAITGPNQAANAIANDVFTNISGNILFARYAISPVSVDGCLGDTIVVTLAVDAEPILLGSLNNNTCSDVASGLDLNTSLVSLPGNNYNIVSITVDPGLVAAGTNATVGDAQADNVLAGDIFTNTGDAPLTVVYEVSPTSSDLCRGDTISVTLTINPEPVASANLDATVCSDNAAGITFNTNGTSVAAANYTIVSITPAAGLVAAAGNAMTGEAQAASAIAADSYTNTGAVALDVAYEISPVSADGCRGDTITVTLTIDPEPVLADLDAIVCSELPSGIVLNTNGVSVAAASYEIVDIRENGLANFAGTPPTTFPFNTTDVNELVDDAWTNLTALPVDVEYDIVPISAEGCRGDTFTTVLTVNPEPILSTSLDGEACSDEMIGLVLDTEPGSAAATTYILVSVTPSAMLTANSGNASPGTGLSATALAGDIYANITLVSHDVIYAVAPVSAEGCIGDTQTVTISIRPRPALQALPGNVCLPGTPQADLTKLVTDYRLLSRSFDFYDADPSTGSAAIGTAPAFRGTPRASARVLVSPTVTSDYWVIARTPDGCTDTAVITITVNQSAAINATPDQTFCPGDPVSLSFSSSTPVTLYSWTNDNPATGLAAAGTNDINFTATNTTGSAITSTIIVRAIDGGCASVADTFSITVNPAPIVSNLDTMVCSGEPVGKLLTAAGMIADYDIMSVNMNGLSVLGGNPGIAANVMDTEVADDRYENTTGAPVIVTYQIVANGVNGCESSPFELKVTVKPAPVFAGAIRDTLANGQFTPRSLAADLPGTIFNWTAPALGTSLVSVNSLSNGPGTVIDDAFYNVGMAWDSVVYDLDLSSADGCGSTARLVRYIPPVPQLSPDTLRLCENSIGSGQASFDLSTVGNYTWYDASGAIATPHMSMGETVYGITGGQLKPVVLIVNPAPAAPVFAQSTIEFCPGEAMTLDPGTDMYNYYGDSDLVLLLAQNQSTYTSAGPATIWVTTNNGTCESGAVMVSLTVKAITASASGIPTICSNSDAPLTGTGTGTGTLSYSWTSIPAGYTSSLQNPVVTTAELPADSGDVSFVLTVTDADGCEATDTAVVFVDKAPDAGDDVTVTVPFCTSDNSVVSLFDLLSAGNVRTPNRGGVWAGPVAPAQGDRGTIVPSTLAPGTYNFTYGVVRGAPCAYCAKAVVTITVTDCGTVQPIVILSGAFDASTSLMRDNLRKQNLLPSIEPYTAAGYTFNGGGGEQIGTTVLAQTGNKAVVDWVIVEVRDSLNPAQILFSRAALLLRDGTVVDVDGSSAVAIGNATGSFYLAIVHRNHLGIMSANTLRGGIYDMRSQRAVYVLPSRINTPVQVVGGNAMMIQGDASGDGQVNSLDLGAIMQRYFTIGADDTDINLDGVTNSLDVGRSFDNYFKQAHLPK
ncbi:MAG: PKD-like domain-containing protein [Bacteroidia bacterium]